MQNTTLKAILAVLCTDPSVSVAERGQIMRRVMTKERAATQPELVPRLMRRREVAERLSVSLRTVDKLHAQGVLQKVKLPGRIRACGFREADVNAILSAQ